MAATLGQALLLISLIVLAVIYLPRLPWIRRPLQETGEPKTGGKIPISVNRHFTRQCNKTCGFCFHTAKTS